MTAASPKPDHSQSPHGGHSSATHLHASAPSEKSKLRLTIYNENEIHDEDIVDVKELKKIVDSNKDKIVWLNVLGIPDAETATAINDAFDIHHFVPLEQLKAHQRSKFELFEDQIMIIAWTVSTDGGLKTHQLAVVGSKSFVITFQSDHLDLTAGVHEKLQKAVNKIRRHHADYLLYSLVNDMVDSYFPCLERYGERLETVENQIVDNPTKRSISQIHMIKRDLLTVRRHIWSLREAINGALRDASDWFESATVVHMRDAYDHSVQLIDFVETYRELAADLMDVYLSSISNRMNEVMKVLTIITTIFVPPGLIAAIYGMNFRQDVSPLNMPELSWYYGYPFAICLMLALALTTLGFFWLKGWLGETPKFMRALKKKSMQAAHGVTHNSTGGKHH